MALKKSWLVKLKYQLCNKPLSAIAEQFVTVDKTVDNSYIKIQDIAGDKAVLNMTVVVLSEDKVEEYDRLSYTFTPSVDEGSSDFIKQGYEYLKTLSEFAGATDC